MHAWEQIQQSVEYIEDHLNEEISIRDLSEMASLSVFYFQRLFSRLVKKPVAEYIKLRRMARATEELINKDRRILDVAVELGFSSHEHFTRTFKNTFGMTPDEYRNQPVTLNRMTKPELLLHYTLIDEGVPLITDGIVLEINRRQLTEPVHYTGMVKQMPVQFLEGLGTESGVDPLDTLWRDFHRQKKSIPGLKEEAEEIGVAYPCPGDNRQFYYFAGAKTESGVSQLPPGYEGWELRPGEYIVCFFEAENFESLVMDILYKAQQYVYNVWLPNHNLRTEAFCAERYKSHGAGTTGMEIWLKITEK